MKQNKESLLYPGAVKPCVNCFGPNEIWSKYIPTGEKLLEDPIKRSYTVIVHQR